MNGIISFFYFLYSDMLLVSYMIVIECVLYIFFFFFFKQKTAYEMRISDWSPDVCSSDLLADAIRNLPRTSILDSVWILIKLEFQNLSLLNKLRRLAKAPSGSMPAKSGFFLFAVAPRRQPGR